MRARFYRPAALALAFLIGLAGPACGNTDPPQTSSGAEDLSVPAEESVTVPLCEVKAEIDAHYGEPVDASAGYGNLLRGLTYTHSEPWNDAYQGTETTLTDGVLPESFNRYAWVGIDPGHMRIDFDLGEVKENIGGFRALFLYIPSYAIQLPQFVEFAVSEDGKDFFTVARLYSPTGLTSEGELYDCDFRTGRFLRARYIRFTIRVTYGIIFLGELETRGYGLERDDSGDFADVYPPYELPDCDPVYRDGGTEAVNLALGDSVRVYAGAYSSVEKANIGETPNPQDTSRLHDGITETIPDWNSDASFRMTRGDGRDLVFDLGYVAAVSHFAADMLSMPSWGVALAERIGVSVSVDGKEWQTAAVMENPGLSEDGNAIVRYGAWTDRPYKARFVKFSFLIHTHAAFSEIEIYGTEKVPENAAEPSGETADPDCAMPDRYPSENVMGMEGVRNILCSYLCQTSGPCGVESTMLTAADYLDLIAYRPDGEIKDVLFDHMVVTPHGNFAPESEREYLSGWMPFFDTQFAPGRGLEAISKAAEEIGKAVGKPDYKEGVFLSIIRPFLPNGSGAEFGDVDGDGVPEKRDSLEDRKKIIRWEVDMQLRRLEEIDAPHIRMCGFYWLSEALYTDDPDEYELVRYAIDYVHQKGYPVFWIPYYDANGAFYWKDLGFDFACLQPNYAFLSVDDPDRLMTAARKAKLYGMSVEIELNTVKNPDSVRRYREYLAAGLEYGYDCATKVYYLGGVPSDLLAARDSTVEDTRRIYEETYAYAAGTLPDGYGPGSEVLPSAPEPLSLSGGQGGKLTGKIVFEQTDGAQLVFTELPAYGTLRYSADGTLTYIPEKGFYGEDSFCAAVRAGDRFSPETRITVTVAYRES